MKLSDLPDAYRMQQTLEHCERIAAELPNELIRIAIGNMTVTCGVDDPQRPLLEGAISDFVAYLRRQASDKLASYEFEEERKQSEYSGFQEDEAVNA